MCRVVREPIDYLTAENRAYPCLHDADYDTSGQPAVIRGHSRLNTLSDSSKWLIYAALNFAFCTALLIGAVVNGGSLAQLPYVALLFAICSSPVPFVDRFNGAFAMLSAAMVVYFFEFGALDAMSMLKPHAKILAVEGSIGRTEVVVWIGALMQIVGFHAVTRLAKGRERLGASKDWPKGLLVPIGILLWSAAVAATLYHDFVVQPDNSSVSVMAGLTKLGIWNTTGLILIENYAGPLGIIILAYWWATSGNRAGTALMLALFLAQFILGWVVDTKEVAISAPVIALATRFMVDGKVPLRWFIGAIVAIGLMFPILSAKRVVMSEELQLTRLEALPRTLEIIARTLEELDAVRAGKYGEQRSETFLERESVKGNVDLIVKGIESGHPYRLGSTFEPLLYVFFPRVFWSAKPGGNSAQQLNREFHISADPDTFISPSHLGEWYWNFGLAGVIVGMALSGALLGYISRRFDLSVHLSVTRVLVLMVTLYLLVVRSEGQIELQYALWARSVLLIGLLHLVLARRVDRSADGAASDGGAVAGRSQPVSLPKFPNLMH
jgi:hypothetical protein